MQPGASLEKLVQFYPRSLISDFYRVFGGEPTAKLLTVFAGTTMRIPGTREIQKLSRNIAIYETLRKAKSEGKTRKVIQQMSEKYGISKRRVRVVYREVRRRDKAAKKIFAKDYKVGARRKS